MTDGEDVYCTLVMNDAYLPGAAVLSHSLRDCGTTKKLACLILQDSLRASTIEELQSLYNYVIPIERIGNPYPGNLYLMNRPDLLYTFTKINLWRQTQFRKIVYIDADVVALRAPEELFDLPDAFAAAPDVGWPDAFNTGVMVLKPDMGEYYALRGLAKSGDSFDGADQGLLNQYFEYRPWKRLSFTYNTTPSANYQYEPAYRYWKRNIALAHFIGKDKPWQRGREELGAPSAFQEMLSRWWAVYDRHFKVSTTDYVYGQRNPVSSYVREDEGKSQQTQDSLSATGYPTHSTQPAPPPQGSHHQSHHESRSQSQHHPPGTASPLMTEPGEHAENIDQGRVQPAPTAEQRIFAAPHMEWDATRNAPPVESRPEAANFPSTIYEFSADPAPFRPPPKYPEPPRDMYYQVPPPAPVAKSEEKPKPIFPWEERNIRPTRRFAEEEPLPPPPRLEPEPAYLDELEVTDRSEPITPTIKINDTDPWQAFSQSRNAWDDNASINNYVRALTSFQKNRGNIQVVQQNVPSTGQAPHEQHLAPTTEEHDPEDLVQRVEEARDRRESLILTDFPSAIERPSLPVTPAPRRRSTFWGDEGRDDEGELPPAEGVPDQADWDPTAQLEQLRRSSLIGPGDLKMPERKLSQRQMPESSASISHSASNQSNIPDTIGEDGETVLTARNDSSGTASAATGGSSFFSLDGAQSSPLLFGSTSDRTSYSATSNTSRKTTPATIQQDRSTGLDTADSSGVTQLNTAINQGSVTMPGGYPLESPGSAFLGGGEPGSSKVPAAIDEKEARDFENGLTTAGQGEPSPREERRPAP